MTIEGLPDGVGSETMGDKLFVRSDGAAAALVKLSEPFDRLQPRRRIDLGGGRSVAAPSSIASTPRHLCADGFQHHATGQLQPIAVGIHEHRLGMVLEPMTAMMMATVAPLREQAIELTHAVGQVRCWRLDE